MDEIIIGTKTVVTTIKDPTMQFGKLKLLFEYTKFHIGLYTGVVGALLAMAQLGKEKFEGLHLVLLVLSILIFALRVCVGGGVASNIAESESVSFSLFLTQDIGFWWWKQCTAERWISLEHISFWIGVTIGLVAFVIYFWKGSKGTQTANILELPYTLKVPLLTQDKPQTLKVTLKLKKTRSTTEPSRNY